MYYLSVAVSDNGTPSLSANLALVVEVSDMNDNPSTTRPLVVDVYAFEETLPGAVIADVRPLDPDTSGDYRCMMDSGDASVFSVDAGSCMHRYNTFIDFIYMNALRMITLPSVFFAYELS